MYQHNRIKGPKRYERMLAYMQLIDKKIVPQRLICQDYIEQNQY